MPANPASSSFVMSTALDLGADLWPRRRTFMSRSSLLEQRLRARQLGRSLSAFSPSAAS